MMLAPPQGQPQFLHALEIPDHALIRAGQRCGPRGPDEIPYPVPHCPQTTPVPWATMCYGAMTEEA